ncbi:MAG: OmpA family protein [Paracoccus sp. (in: a-proteobacteria)]|nr:OmpA family protein [Paracoccus sp. (in: a-proteobacteria)]
MQMFRRALATLALLAVANTVQAQDYPDLGRFEGAEQFGYDFSDYDEARIITGPFRYATERGEGWQTFEGRRYLMYYRLPPGRSALEAQRSYEASLKGKGYDIAFSCSASAGDCFLSGAPDSGLSVGIMLDTPDSMPRLGLDDVVRHKFMNGNARVTYARKPAGGGDIHISLVFSDDETIGRYVIAQVIESGEMQTGQIGLTEASTMQTQLDEAGKIDLYGILFDFDSAAIRPESTAQLAEIAAMMQASPDLSLTVIGHTDNQGAASYNQNLSQRRADAVVVALVQGYGIAAARLSGIGQGMTQPVASNDTDEGRARNRRVELRRR